MKMCMVLFDSLVTEPSEISEHSCDLLPHQERVNHSSVPKARVISYISSYSSGHLHNRKPYITFVNAYVFLEHVWSITCIYRSSLRVNRSYLVSRSP
jgi:hypothetical protein